jgi:hypothetical protein
MLLAGLDFEAVTQKWDLSFAKSGISGAAAARQIGLQNHKILIESILRTIFKYWHQLCFVSCGMRELGTGFLMLLACGAFYVQADPTIWNSFSQSFARLLG